MQPRALHSGLEAPHDQILWQELRVTRPCIHLGMQEMQKNPHAVRSQAVCSGYVQQQRARQRFL